MQLEDLLYYLHHPDKLDQLDEETLSSLVRKYPYIESLKSAYFKKLPGTSSGHQDINEKLADLVHSSYSSGSGQDILLPTVFDLVKEVSNNINPEETHSSELLTPIQVEVQEQTHQPIYSYTESAFIRYLKSLPECTVPMLDSKGQNTRPIISDPLDDISTSILHTDELIQSSLDLRETVASESLANLWVSQGKPDLAIQIFEKLLAEFPEKSSIFAAKIEKLKAENSL